MIVSYKALAVCVFVSLISSCMSEMDPYIVGGRIARIEQFPHSVYMYTSCYKLSWMCGASVLTQDMVLTAAHCLTVCQQDLDVIVYVGSEYIHQMPVGRHVSHYMLHEKFDDASSRNDIALVRAKSPFPLGPKVKRVIIQKRFPGVKRALLAGWGIMNERAPRAIDRLQWTWQPIRSGDCSQFRILPGMMCFHNHIDYHPSHGDSGSALMANSQQIGVVSFKNMRRAELIVYMNVSYYYDWIKQRARQLRCNQQPDLMSSRHGALPQAIFLSDISKTIAMIPLESLGVFVLLWASCTSEMEPFIAGGSYATIEQFPHSTYLYMVCKDPQSCGGSILTQRVVMTAAHCFEDCVVKHDIVAYAGSENIEKMTVGDRVNKFRIHDQYNSKSITNDIALGFVSSNFPLGNTVKRIMITRNFPGVKMARVAGWGIVNDVTQEETEKLKMVVQIIQPVIACRKVVNQFGAGMLCADNNMKNRPSRGDSGSALISGTGQQIGLVSFRSPKKMDLVVYTNVSHYYDWIETHVRVLMCS